MKSVKYLEAVKAKYNLKNDRQLALHMSMGTNTISQYMSGKRIMDEEACLAVAMMLEFDEHQTMQVIMAAGIDRAEKAGQQSLWTVFSQRMAATAASALLVAGVSLFLTPQNAEASTHMASFNVVEPSNLYYVKLHVESDRPNSDTISTWLKRMFGPAALPATAS
ncbi:Cro/Cl family transcriptional regulator [Duganella aquatilis]|uniref:Cro/Cl family transcriptional regulator n=1 Tax=Duganella aquatilis TaxID=2666082 RepID=UPI0012B0A606|nr:Cro/Cl family transcriptional regulator [Duganella aquatilis]